MLRIVMSTAGEEAARYYDAALGTSDYYVSGHGRWGGKGAERLGLKGEVDRSDFVALAKNQTPGNPKEQLTVRTKTTRQEVNPETGETEEVVTITSGPR